MSSIGFRIAVASLASVAVLSLACGSEDVLTPTPGGPGSSTPVGGQPGIISGYDAVYFSLRNASGEVDKGDEIKQSFFSVPGRIIKMNGKEIQVFEYQNVSAAEAAAGRISPDGYEIRSADGAVAMVDWIAPPHFYRHANTIVLYVGDDATVLGVLEKALGTPFAAGPSLGMGGPGIPITVTVLAPIDSMKVERSENVPLSYVATVESGLPNSCIKFGEYKVDRQENSFRVTVTNLAPGDPNMVCLQVYGMVKSVIPLPGPFVEGIQYSVDVNGKQATFVGGEAGSTMQKSEPGQTGDTRIVLAPIDEVQVLVLESAPVQYRLLVKSGLPDSCARFDGYEVQREGDTVRVTVNNRLPTGAVACAQVYGTIENSIAIGNGNDFQRGRLITVFVNDKKTAFVAQ